MYRKIPGKNFSFPRVLFPFVKTSNRLLHSLPQIYEELYHTINNSDHQKDLKWWSNNHGVNMAMNWPSFVVCLVNFLFLKFEVPLSVFCINLNFDLSFGML